VPQTPHRVSDVMTQTVVAVGRDALWRGTVDYYLRRTSHGSALSGLVHGLVLLARAGRAEAWQYVQEPWRRISPMFRASRPAKAFTAGRWPGPSTSSSAG
jgi:hypothetical protein